MNRRIWKDYVWGKQSLQQLSKAYNKSIPVIRKILDRAPLSEQKTLPKKVILIADVTFFGRGYGILVCRSEKHQKNIYWKEVHNESPLQYLQARKEIERQGYTIEAIVLDGKRGIREVFSDIPVQMCQFHQKAIVRRYLTQNPRLPAAKELWNIVQFLPTIRKEDFECLLSLWYSRWEGFLRERTYDEDGRHWHYTHRRVRSAYRSLRENLDFLFTHQKHPELSIPNTTNSLDGSFGHMKTLLKNHRGVSKKRRFKMIEEILGK